MLPCLLALFLLLIVSAIIFRGGESRLTDTARFSRQRARLEVGILEDRTMLNAAPLAVLDTFAVHQGQILNISSPNLLANDSDADQDPLTVELVSGVAHGALYLDQNYDPLNGWSNVPGGFYYVPFAGYVGEDVFAYRLFDGTDYSESVTVTIDVTNQVPEGMTDGVFDVHQGDTLNVSGMNGVLANDSDADGDSLSAILVTNVEHGSLYLNQNYDPVTGWSNVPGGFHYVPFAGYAGPDSFTYLVFDGAEYSLNVTVTLDVTNQAPVAEGDGVYEVHQGDTLNVSSAVGILNNDSDLDEDSLVAELVSSVAHGALYLNQNYDPNTGWSSALGGFYYVAFAGYTGEDAFTYRVFDGAEYSEAVTVTIDVTNQAPVAEADGVYEVYRNRGLNVSAAEGLLLNDFDPDGDPLMAELVVGVSHGSLYLNQNYDPETGWTSVPGGFHYVPNADYTGDDTFSYRITDGAFFSNIVAVPLNVVQGVFRWDGGAADNKMSSAANWERDVLPLAGDTIIFDGTVSNKSATADTGFASDLAKIEIKNGYNGTITISQNTVFHQYVQSAGTVVVSANQELRFETSQMNGGTISGPGSLLLDVGNAPTMTMSGGKFDSGLSIEINPDSTLRVNANVDWADAVISNDGMFEWSGGNISANGGSFSNWGSVQITGNNDFGGANAAMPFMNHSVVEKIGENGVTNIWGAFTDDALIPNRTPTVNVTSGTLNLRGTNMLANTYRAIIPSSRVGFIGTTSLQSSLVMAGQGQFDFADIRILAGTTITSSVHIRLTGFMLGQNLVGGGGRGGEFVNNGIFESIKGTMLNLEGFTNMNSFLVHSNNAVEESEFNDLLFENHGIFEWTGPAHFTLDNNTQFVNVGVFDIKTNALMKMGGAGGSIFANQGTFSKMVGGGVTAIDVPFSNAGVVRLNGFELEFGTYQQISANAGTYLDGGTITATNGLEINDGILSGGGTIVGDVLMNGRIDFGNVIGTLTVLGNYVQTENALMIVKIAGNGANDTDLLDVHGNVTLNGMFDVQLVGGYQPAINTHNSIFVLTTGTIDGVPDAPPFWLIEINFVFAELIY